MTKLTDQHGNTIDVDLDPQGETTPGLTDRLEALTWGHANNPVVSVQPQLSADECKAIVSALRSQFTVESLRAERDEFERMWKGARDALGKTDAALLDRAETAERAVGPLQTIATKILAKLDGETASVTQWDADELRAALSTLPVR